MIEFGKKYKDKITGFEGVATGKAEYISGCNQALLAPTVGSDGALKDSQWLDVQRLEELPGKTIALDNGDAPGCDRAAPTR